MLFLSVTQTFLVILLILMGIGVFFLGDRLMAKIDQFSIKGGFRQSPSQQPSVLAFGDKALFSNWHQSEAFKKRSIQWLATPDPSAFSDYDAVMAFSESDVENLLFCRLAKHLNPRVYTIAWCSDKTMASLYREAKIDRVYLEKPSVNSMDQSLKDGQL